MSFLRHVPPERSTHRDICRPKGKRGSEERSSAHRLYTYPTADLSRRTSPTPHCVEHDDHNHQDAYLTSSNKNDASVRITRFGLYANLGMPCRSSLEAISIFNS